MQSSARIATTHESDIPASRRFFRRVKSNLFRSATLYRLYLRCRFGGRVSDGLSAGLPNGVLQSRAEWQEATRMGKQLHLPLHRSEEKNWDHLAAVRAILGETSRTACVLDAGAEFYSNVLPALFLCGYRNLYGMNLSFTDPAQRGPIQYLPGDITATGFPDGFFDAITCMSVIEHEVPLQPYFEEMYRLLKPGGILITSTDYYPEPIDTRNMMAHQAPIKIFSRREVHDIFKLAEVIGFDRTAPIELECSDRPVRWDPYGLEYSFLIFTLRKPRVG